MQNQNDKIIMEACACVCCMACVSIAAARKVADCCCRMTNGMTGRAAGRVGCGGQMRGAGGREAASAAATLLGSDRASTPWHL